MRSPPTIAVAMIVFYAAPAIVTILSFVLHGERPSRTRVGSLALAFAGLLLVVAAPMAGALPRIGYEMRRSVRVLTADRLPMVGRIDPEHRVYFAGGLGSRGVVWSGVLGELVPALVTGEPLVFPGSWVRALDPLRFLEGATGRAWA